jgi:hypothetical protein
MITVKVVSKVETKLRTYAALANKSIKTAVHEEAKLTSKRLMDLTPPKSKAQGAKRVMIDIGKVYLQAKFFLEVFNFTAVKFGEKVKEFIRKKDASGLTKVFSRSAKLVQIHIEPFKEAIIKRFRGKDGRVPKNVKPLSLPLNAESARKTYEEKKKKLIGYVKSGWANCFKALGGSVPSWLSHAGTGHVRIDQDSVTLTNTVSYAADPLQGRKRDLSKKIERLLKDARKV